MAPRTRVAVVGGGWAGLAAAVRARTQGHAVTLFEMAPQLGGRARRVDADGLALDNGQHILIGAYRETLALMRSVGVSPDAVLQRRPLALVYPDGSGLRLPPGPAALAFVRAVAGAGGWSWPTRWALLRAAAGWGWRRFQVDGQWTVDRLTRHLPRPLRDDLIDPLCVAALNTPAAQASAQVFLRVLRDALFSGAGAADLLLPRVPLSALLPEPARVWLQAAGAELHLGHRVDRLQREATGWAVDGQPFDAVVLACSAVEAARLTRALAPAWSAQAAAIAYEPIVTVYLRSAGSRLAQPMTALRTSAQAPAQFVFDLGALGGAEGVFAFVISGARDWVARGQDATVDAVREQALQAFAAGTWRGAPALLRCHAERRATFLCTPGLARPPGAVRPGLAAAGDYVAGPYPATLEGAVRSGQAAVDVALGIQGAFSPCKSPRAAAQSSA